MSDRLHIRRAVTDDAMAIIEVHRTAVCEKASQDYDPAVIEAWSPKEITTARIEKLKCQILDNDWLTLIAEADECILGFGQVNPRKNTLGAVYVRKNCYGNVGMQLVERLIAYAKDCNATHLELEASINAESFTLPLALKALIAASIFCNMIV